MLAFGLIVLGGVVRITGSGMGCGDHWPLCNGEWFPPLDLPTMIEIGHRWAAALVSMVVLRHDCRRLDPAPHRTLTQDPGHAGARSCSWFRCCWAR